MYREIMDSERILFEDQGSILDTILWLDEGSGHPPVFRLTQVWHEDGERHTIYLYLHELEKIAQIARDYVNNTTGGHNV